MTNAENSFMLGINIGNAFEIGEFYFNAVTPGIRIDTSSADFRPYINNNCHYNTGGKRGSVTCTAITLLCRLLIGEARGSLFAPALADRILEKISMEFYTNTYLTCYLTTMAMHEMGGEYWRKWNRGIKKVLCAAQCRGGCADGSWPNSAKGRTGIYGGRFLITVFGCLMLETYYRYPPAYLSKQ